MFSSNKKVFRPNQSESTVKKSPFSGLPSQLQELQLQKDKLCKRIDNMQQRLMFAYSEPLNDQCLALMKEDLKLSSQMTDILVTLNKKRK